MQLPGDGESRSATATPSKPFQVRKRDAQLLSLMSGLKLLAPEGQADRFTPDLANGRIFFDRVLLAERRTRDSPPEPKMAAIEAQFPGTTEEVLQAKIAEADSRREASPPWGTALDRMPGSVQ